MVPYLLTCLAVIAFAIAVAARTRNYLKEPMHVRWELYPVPHEAGRASYGGSYMEEIDWWKKPRRKSRMGELKFMIPEILLLKGVWEKNRRLWYVSFPFHFGLYLTAGFLGLIVLGALMNIFGISAGTGPAPGSLVTALTGFVGPAGFILAFCGAVALFFRRLSDSSLREYSAFGHFFNLGLFIVVMGIAIITWLLADPQFNMAREFVANLISFRWTALGSSLFTTQVVCGVLLMAYIPLTHMSHFFMKYFLWHDIRWGDEPNINKPETDAKINEVLGYKVTWAAPHIAIKGKHTWAEIATYNPMSESEAEKEKDNDKK